MNHRVPFHSTTILSVRRGCSVAIGSDGQATLGSMAVKSAARKIYSFLDGRVLVGFAGSLADGTILLENLERQLLRQPENIQRATVEFSKECRLLRPLRGLNASLVVVSANETFVVEGGGVVIRPDDDLASIGSGSPFALAAAKALLIHTDLSASEIVTESLKIASQLDIYTNTNIVVEELPC